MDYMNRIRLRCYMRGLGIGIVVTVLILGLTMANRGRAMSDDEVRERARELGMVESTVLSQMQSQQNQQNQQKQEEPDDGGEPENGGTPEDGVSPEEDTSQEDGEEPDDGGEPESGGEPEDSVSPEEGTSPEDGGEPESGGISENDAARETVLFTITRGESSVDVSRALAALGLVEDAGAYDRYLCENGYATRIVAETHRIPVCATEEEIAQIITKN